MVKILERDVLRAILQLLATERIFAGRINSAGMKIDGRFFTSHSFGPGAADILAFPDFVPVPLWIEVKAPGGQQSAEQASFQQKVEQEGHFYLLARSSEEVLGWVRRYRG